MNLDVGAPVSQTKLAAVTAAAIKACDGLDGVTDGVINDPRQCRFDPHVLACGRPGAPTDGTCLASQEADAVQQIWRGARGTHGEFLWYGLEPGASFAGLANSSSAMPPVALPFTITLDHRRLWIKQDPSFDWHTLTTASFETGFRKSQAKFHEVIGSDDADLSAFRAYGGKIITYHGWTDQLIFPRGSIDYFDRVVAANGGLKRVQEFDRLFMVPGNEPLCRRSRRGQFRAVRRRTGLARPRARCGARVAAMGRKGHSAGHADRDDAARGLYPAAMPLSGGSALQGQRRSHRRREFRLRRHGSRPL
jgi:hypothetical protein